MIASMLLVGVHVRTAVGVPVCPAGVAGSSGHGPTGIGPVSSPVLESAVPDSLEPVGSSVAPLVGAVVGAVVLVGVGSPPLEVELSSDWDGSSPPPQPTSSDTTNPHAPHRS